MILQNLILRGRKFRMIIELEQNGICIYEQRGFPFTASPFGNFLKDVKSFWREVIIKHNLGVNHDGRPLTLTTLVDLCKKEKYNNYSLITLDKGINLVSYVEGSHSDIYRVKQRGLTEKRLDYIASVFERNGFKIEKTSLEVSVNDLIKWKI